MEVRPISNNQSFNGYVGKSVTKYINKAVKNEIRRETEILSGYDKELDKKRINELRDFGTKILNRLSAYMKHTHKNTALEMGNTKYLNHPRFKNSISSHIVRVYSPLTNTEPFVDNYGTIAMPKTMALNPKKNAGAIDLKKLDDFCNKLEKIEPKDIDMAFYKAEKSSLNELVEEETGFIDGIIRTFKEEKVQNFLEQINEKHQ